ncbi:type II secretion system major pseudopilin GspG [Kiritimatiella glycovorans]|uniref:Type II secretion system core protein G n=1 Tax=Kiritimatiella glycovorans TaxID=1307763 RepID=A0A0G3EGQ9_9BACT|nr:type II secretion system major pseudopilin GspG [Kiritimatiella glycovorans]AKJ63995.1 PilD-dependent protein PddA [Kiritimatiella glycovorans]
MKRKERRTAGRAAREGFTLIEILLVVVIIGILVGIAVPRFTGRVEQSRVAAAESTLKSISTALDLYELDMGRYPDDLEALEKQPEGADNWRGPYLKSGIPEDPWGQEYVYKHPGTHNPHGYDLHSLGPQGGEPITNWE